MYQVKREMGCTVEDLLRWLPKALGQLYALTNLELDGRFLLVAKGPLITISGFSRPDRKIALLHIPVLDLTISFAPSLNKLEIEEALSRFDLYTRRGGG